MLQEQLDSMMLKISKMDRNSFEYEEAKAEYDEMFNEYLDEESEDFNSINN
jgi:hypothetical protein